MKIKVTTDKYGYMGLPSGTQVNIAASQSREGDVDWVLFNHSGRTWNLDYFDFEVLPEDDDEQPELIKSGSELTERKLGKVQMDLVDTGFPNALWAIGEVMTWAAENKGYKPNDWKGLDSNDFLGAASRHRTKRMKGQKFDDESGLYELAHEAFNVLAQLELLILEKEGETK